MFPRFFSAFGEDPAEKPGWPLTIIVFILAAIPRLTSLRAFIAHDETLYWEWARAFFFALLHGDWQGTIVGPGNPSVTLFWNHTLNMGLKYVWAWVAGVQATALSTWPDFQPQATFEPLIERRLPIVFFNTLAVVIAYRLTHRLFGRKIALFAAVLLALDPFYLADSRTARGEGLLASFAMLAVLSYLAYWVLRRYRYLLFSGVVTGLALLTKMSTISVVIWAAVVVLILALTRPGLSWRDRLKPALITWAAWGLLATVTFWALWPAMWVSPLKAFSLLSSFVSDVGVSGRDNYFFGHVYHSEPLPFYYLVVYLLRVTPLAWLGLLAAFDYLRHGRFGQTSWDPLDSGSLRPLWITLILAFAMIYSVMITIGTLKRDWYLIPAFPALDIVAAAGLVWVFQSIWDRWGNRWVNRVSSRTAWAGGLVATLMLQGVLVLAAHPYYYTYWNPIVLGNRWAAQAVMVGWDLDLSVGAYYLNTKPHVGDMWAATFSTRAFEQIFKGHTVRWTPDQPWIRADYLVVRRAHLQLQKLAPYLLDYVSHLSLEHVVTIGGVDYLWIYKGPRADHFAGPSRLAGKAILLGYDLGYPRAVAGDALPVKLYWQNEGMAPGDDLFLRLVDAGGYVWAEAVAIPLPGFGEAARIDDQIVESQVALRVPVGTPPGTYFLHSGVYDNARQETLGYFTLPPDGDQLTVARPTQTLSATQLSIEHELDLGLSPELSLLGFDLPGGTFVIGDENWLTLYWQAEVVMGNDYVIGLQLLGPDGEEVAYWLGRPVMSGYPTSEWRAGEIVRDPWRLELPAGTAPGNYSLRLALFNAETRAVVARVTLGDVSVTERRRQFDIPTMQKIVNVHLGDHITLLGYDLFAEPIVGGGDLRVTLYWQARTIEHRHYTVFVHLVGPDGRVVAQHDGPPADGTLPIIEWTKGEVISDRHRVEFNQLPPGTYQVVVGMYDSTTLVRLPIFAADGSALGDNLLLQRIEIR